MKMEKKLLKYDKQFNNILASKQFVTNTLYWN